MVVQIFVSQTQSISSLRHKISNRMFNSFRIPIVYEACGELPQDSSPLLHLPQHQAASIRRDIPAVKISRYFSTTQLMKFEGFRFTLCQQKAAPLWINSASSQSLIATLGGLFRSISETISVGYFKIDKKLQLRPRSVSPLLSNWQTSPGKMENLYGSVNPTA